MATRCDAVFFRRLLRTDARVSFSIRDATQRRQTCSSVKKRKEKQIAKQEASMLSFTLSFLFRRGNEGEKNALSARPLAAFYLKIHG